MELIDYLNEELELELYYLELSDFNPFKLHPFMRINICSNHKKRVVGFIEVFSDLDEDGIDEAAVHFHLEIGIIKYPILSKKIPILIEKFYYEKSIDRIKFLQRTKTLRLIQ